MRVGIILGDFKYCSTNRQYWSRHSVFHVYQSPEVSTGCTFLKQKDVGRGKGGKNPRAVLTTTNLELWKIQDNWWKEGWRSMAVRITALSIKVALSHTCYNGKVPDRGQHSSVTATDKKASRKKNIIIKILGTGSRLKCLSELKIIKKIRIWCGFGM